MSGFCRATKKKNTEGKPQRAHILGTITAHYLHVCPSQSHPCMNMWPFLWPSPPGCWYFGGGVASDVVGAKEKPYVICSGCVTSRTWGGQVPSFLQGWGIMRLKNSKTAAAGRPHSLHVCRVNLCCSRKLIPTLLQELKRSFQWVKRGKQPIIQHVWALHSSKKKKKN